MPHFIVETRSGSVERVEAATVAAALVDYGRRGNIMDKPQIRWDMDRLTASDMGKPRLSMAAGASIDDGELLDVLVGHWDRGPYCDLADLEGWNIFESDTFGWMIEADAESAVFTDDLETMAHVGARAARGSYMHRLALQIDGLQRRVLERESQERETGLA